MGKILSVDLRKRVVAAISKGMSYRAAAEQFQVSASSATRWVALARGSGDVTPKRQGGDRRSARIEAHAQMILDAMETTPDITLAELRTMLAEQGIDVGIATLWRFFERRQLTRKKRPCMPRSRTAPTF
jgi:transposase